MQLMGLDVFIVSGYLVLILGIGWWKGRQERDTDDFIVGNREIPWWAVLASIVATEISAVTFLNVPGTAFTGDLTYLQFGIGSIAGRFVVATLFISAFYRMRCLTVYSYLAERFGPKTRYAATGLFLFSRMLGSGLRLSLAATGISVIFDLSFGLTLFLFTTMALIYTIRGGIKAIVWTDLVQACVFIGGGLVLLGWLDHKLGWDLIWSTASEAGKTRLINLTPEVNTPGAWINGGNLFPLAFLNGFIVIIASLGTDQDLTQRMLTCRNANSARRSVILSGFVGIPVAGLFLLIGLGLYAYVHHSGNLGWSPDLNSTGQIDPNRVFAEFIGNVAPTGLKGLLISGVFAAAMSSIDSAMGALSSSVTIDLYKPLIRPDAPESHYLKVTRLFVLAFAVILFALALIFRNAGNLLWLALQIASIPAGAMLGIFLLGLLTQRGSDKGNLLALCVALIVSGTLFGLIKTNQISLSWTWLVLIGLCCSCGIGALTKQKHHQ